MLSFISLLINNEVITMSSTTESFPRDPANTFTDGLITAYGKQDAYTIASTLSTSFARAFETIPLVKVPDISLKLRLDNDPYYDGPLPRNMRGYVRTKQAEVEVILNSGADIDVLTEMIPQFVEHEVGHIAHYQYTPELWEKVWNVPFGNACIEGVGRAAENFNFIDYCNSLDVSIDDGYALAKQELEKTLAGAYDGISSTEYLFGDSELHQRGYFVGSYVVSSLMWHEGMDLRKVMKTSPDHLKRFAESELL